MDSTDKLFERLDRISTELTKLAVTQDFILENQRQRILVEKEVDERLKKMEYKINFAAGVIAVAALFLSTASQWIWRKVAGS